MIIIAILVSTQLLCVLSYSSTYFEQGQIIVGLGDGSVLSSSSALPRSQTVEIIFSKAFTNPPQVFLSIGELDWPENLPQGFSLKATFIHTKGFKIVGSAVSTNRLLSLYANWVAIDDPRIQVVEFETYDLGVLEYGNGDRKVQFQVGHSLKDASNGLIALIGVRHISFNLMADVKLEEVTQTTFTISAREAATSKVDYIKVNVLLGTDQSLWSTPIKEEYYYGHPFVTRWPSAYTVQQTFPYSQDLNTGKNFPIGTTRGYNVEGQRNLRLHLQTAPLTTTINFLVYTWDTTLVYEFYSQAAIYIDDPQLKIFDQNCAEMFSECNYNGDSQTICDIIPDLQAIGWSQPIKSLSIPTPGKLILFSQTSQQGQKTIIMENQQCLEFNTDILSADLQPQLSFIKILFFNPVISNCLTVKFYSQCNYQGSMFQVSKGEHLKLEIKIPFEIKSISICPNIIVKLRGPKYFGGQIVELYTSQTCLDGYKFPKYVQQN